MNKALLILSILISFTLTVSAQAKQIAITIDDLPFVDGAGLPISKIEKATHSLLNKLNENGIAATGFINGRQLIEADNSKEKWDIAKAWLEKGQSLGNHTYSHPSLTRVSLNSYINNFNKNEEVLKQLYQPHKKDSKYFRYPFLQMGPDTMRKNGFERFLKSNGYQIAPVTIDNSDYIFSKVYVGYYINGNKEMMEKTVESYLQHLKDVIKYYEQIALDVVGRPIKHIFLCHANLINADHFDKVANVFKEEGYAFISLEEALTDNVYQRTDTLTISGGWSHLDRWKSNDRVKTTVTYPEVDEKIMDIYNAK